ncbi:MAG: type IV toxin-antitoxin system AbiEi family antitoxin domain-containing protein [Rhodothermales bacterium]
MQRVSSEKAAQAEAIFREHGGLLRTSEAIDLGIHPRTLYYLRDTRRLDQVSRGVYRLADLPPLDDPDLVTVATRSSEAVICLISALAFHEITLEVPHEVYIALPRGMRGPELDYPPLRVFHYSGLALSEGIEIHEINSVPVKIYSAAKTVADCFKFRNKIGVDVAVEALKRYLERTDASPRTLLKYARICRVERVMQPYLEALV